MKVCRYETEEEQLKAVKEYGFSIQYIDNPSEKVQLEAVRQNGLAIRYIHNPSEAAQLEAIKNNEYSIEFIHNPSEKVQLEIVRQDGFAIKNIHNPSEAVIRYLLDNYISDIKIMQLLFAKIGREGYDKLSDEDKLRLELED